MDSSERAWKGAFANWDDGDQPRILHEYDGPFVVVRLDSEAVTRHVRENLETAARELFEKDIDLTLSEAGISIDYYAEPLPDIIRRTISWEDALDGLLSYSPETYDSLAATFRRLAGLCDEFAARERAAEAAA